MIARDLPRSCAASTTIAPARSPMPRALCETRAHREIEPEHWLTKLLELGNRDVVAIARLYELELDGIWNGLLHASTACERRSDQADRHIPRESRSG
jgi:ATP-dependent Clp protease ATP-binding subunit ClpA